MNKFLEAALQYADLGWHVFPLAPGQKIPIKGSHGVKEATTDKNQIAAWWAQWPNANIAVACGEVSGIYVIDVDVKEAEKINGYESLKEFPELPDTIKQITPRGGFHAFYKTANAPVNRNNFRPGIDIRGAGYYVVLSPSIHPNGGHYYWPDGFGPNERQLAEFPDFMRPATRSPWLAQQPTPICREISTSTDVLERARRYLNECDPAIQGHGGHDKLLWAAVAMVHGFQLSDNQAFDLLAGDYNPRCIPPWDFSVSSEDKDFRRKIREARKLTPQHPTGWLLNDPAYAVMPSIPVDVDKLLSCIPTTESFLRDAYEKVTTYSDNDIPYGISYWLSRPIATFQSPLTNPPGLLGDICSWINATSIKEQPLLSLACSLAFLGALFGQKLRDALGTRTNLYCMGIAPSSAGKAHAMNCIRNLCQEAGCGSLLGGDDIASDSAIEERMSREPVTLFLWDEIGHLLSHIKSGVSRHHAKVVSVLMKLYSAAGSVYRGREYAEAERQRTIRQPCCCIYGTSTPEVFLDALSPSELQDGWLSRCLVFRSLTNPTKSRGRTEDKPPANIVERVNAWYIRKTLPAAPALGQLVTQYGEPAPPEQIVVPTTTEAEKVFVDFDNKSIEYGKENPQLACLWAKAEENARRIALILAGSNSFDNPTITIAEAEYAVNLIEYLLFLFKDFALPHIASSRIEKEKQQIVEFIGRSGTLGCVKREISRYGLPGVGQKHRNELLNDLLEAEQICCVIPEDKKGLHYWTAENYVKMLQNK